MKIECYLCNKLIAANEKGYWQLVQAGKVSSLAIVCAECSKKHMNE